MDSPPQKPEKNARPLWQCGVLKSARATPYYCDPSAPPCLSFTKGGACSPADNKTLSGLTAKTRETTGMKTIGMQNPSQ